MLRRTMLTRLLTSICCFGLSLTAVAARDAPTSIPMTDVFVFSDELPKDSQVLGSYEDVSLAKVPVAQSTGLSENDSFTVADLSTAAVPVEDGSIPLGSDDQPVVVKDTALDQLNDIMEELPTSKSNDFLIAVIDTGGPESVERVSVLGDNGLDEHGHGTCMIETMQAYAPDCSILSIKAFDRYGHGDASTVYAAIKYAIARNVSCINLSFSGYVAEGNAVLKQALDEARDAGILIVGAAGNAGSDVSTYFPGSHEDAFIVGSCDVTGVRKEFSNYGKTVDYYTASTSTSEAAALFSAMLAKEGGIPDNMDAMFVPGDGEMQGRFVTSANPEPDSALSPAFSTTPDAPVYSPTKTDAGSATGLMTPFIDLIVNDAEVPLETTCSDGWIWNERTVPGNKDPNKDHSHYFEVRSSRQTGTDSSGNPMYRSSDGDWINFKYIGAGTYGGQSVDMNIKLTFGNSAGLSESSAVEQRSNSTCVAPRENHTDWEDRTRANPMVGITYFNASHVTATYSFTKTGTNEKIDTTTLWVSWGSLNLYEGVASRCDQTTYYIQPGAYPFTYKDDGNEAGRGSDVIWFTNRTSNDFIDDYRGSASTESYNFWKSIGTVRVNSASKEFPFYLLTKDFWFCPSFNALGAVAPPPVKKIVDGGNKLDSIEKKAGDTVVFEVSQTVETFGYVGNGLLRYPTLGISDTLPNELEFVSAKVLRTERNGRVTDVTDAPMSGSTMKIGSLTHSGQNVSFDFTSLFGGALVVGCLYEGETYTLQITAKVRSDVREATVTNEAQTKVGTSTNRTNRVTVKIKEDPVIVVPGEDEYTVFYKGNGATNFEHLEGEFTQNVVRSSSGMPPSTYLVDDRGSLRTNDFTREGFTFAGWNTAPDGTGESYPDGYSNVFNWAPAGGSVTLYAQWKKKLGHETLQVISEETGNPVPGCTLRLYKKVNGRWTEVPGVGGRVTDSNGEVEVNALHWFDYEWRSVSVPAGYRDMDAVPYRITYNHLEQEDLRILYMKHVRLILDAVVDDIIPGEHGPSFLYHISGTDAAGVEHEYDVLVPVLANKQGTNTAPDLFAGTYTITQTPISRYLPQDAKNVAHATPNGIQGTVDLLHHTYAEILFPYGIRMVGYYGSMDFIDNVLLK